MKKVFKSNNICLVFSVMIFSFLLIKVLFADFLPFNSLLTGPDNLNEGNDIGKFTLTWIPGDTNSTGILDQEDSSIILLSPNTNSIYNAESNTSGGGKVTYQIMFNMGGNIAAPPGSIIIKLPKYIFYDRENNPAEQIIDVPLAEYPNSQGTGFNYRYETDSVTGIEYLVLENYQSIPESYSFEASISWILKTPSVVADNYQKEIHGVVDVDFDLDGTSELHSDSNIIKLQYSSHAAIRSLAERYNTHTEDRLPPDTNIYLSWNNSWNSELKPENPDDYIYMISYAYSTVYYATQPYSLQFRVYPTDENEGVVLGYCSNSTCSSSATITHDYCSVSRETPSSSYNSYSVCSFIIKYPKTKITENVSHTISNKLTEDLIGVDGATDYKEATYSKTFTIEEQEVVSPTDNYVYLSNVIPNPSQTVTKSRQSSYATVQGGINIIENKEIGTNIPFGNIVKNPSSSFRLNGNLQYYSLTLDEDPNADPTLLESYGKKNWKYNLIDDMIFVGDSTNGYERLGTGDYEIESLYFSNLSVYDFIDTTTSTYNSTTMVTTYNVGWQKVNNTDVQSWPIFSLYARIDGDYVLLGTIKYENSRFNYREMNSDEEKVVNSTNQIILPSGTTAIKVTADTNKHSVSVRVIPKIFLKNSEKLKNIVKGKDLINVYNFMTSFAQDSEGNIYDLPSKPSIPSSLKSTIEGLDTIEFGKTVPRYYTYNTYERFEKGNTLANKWVNYQNDPAYRRVKANYTAYEYDYLEYQPGYYDYTDLFDIKAITEQRNGTFYDLLPIGMSPDLDSINVETFVINNNYKIDTSSSNISSPGQSVGHTATIIDNFNNTGRTMLVVKVKLPDENNNMQYFQKSINSSYHYYAYSGYKITFSGYYSWDSIIDYGNNLTNSIAYKSGDNELFEGYPDDASTVSYAFNDKNIFIDLDKDGNPQASTKNDTIYAQRTMSFSFNTASDSSFKISVKTANMTDYVDGKEENVIASAGGYYTYKLRYESQKNVMTRNLVIYNDLEKYIGTNTGMTWQGRIVNVDVSHALEKGINPVIYYSIKEDLDLYKNGKATIDIPAPEDADLTNGEIWTTEKPSDSFKIKAIAVDLSKGQDGNDYVLNSEDSVIILVTMQAPTENVEQLAQEHAQALNAAWWKGITKQGDEPEHLNFSVYENTAVVVGETKANINKSSYVQSGTSMLPAIIHNGDKVIYDIEISNTSTYESLSNIQVVDNLPNELSLIENELSYYFDGEGNVNNSIRISENDLITYVIDNNKITFNIKQLYSSQKIHLLIPVNIISSGQNNDVIMNQAAIISFNGIDYSKDSPITYHEAKYGNIKITKKLKYSQEDEDDDKSFRIKVELIPPSTIIDDGADTIDNVELAMNSTYSDVSFVNGIGYINLKNNESKTIEKLPEGYSFKISEDLDENFVPEVSLEEGTIVDNTTQEIEVVNVRIVNPSTGIEKTINQKTNNNLIILIISLIGDIIAIYFLIKQKKCNQ